MTSPGRTSSLPAPRPQLSSERLLTLSGSRSKTPEIWPSFTGSYPTRRFDFSPLSGKQKNGAGEKKQSAPLNPRSPSALARLHNPRWTDARHTQLVDQALVYLEQRQAPSGFLRKLDSTSPIGEDVADDELLPFTRLVLEEPPRHGKSEHVSRYFTSWYLGRNPQHRVILSSYGDTYAATWGRKARNVLEGLGESAFGVHVSKRTSAANDWEIEGHEGGMVTAGTGGAITGRGANLFVIDDPVKGAKDASSAVMQEHAWDWWQSEASTRLQPDADGVEPIVVIVLTRWNEADLVGRILSNEEETEDAEVWYVLRLPAIAEDEDALGREPGEALWPERWPIEFLRRMQSRLTAYWWSAIYQQRPSPEQGNLFLRDAWQYYDEAPSGGYHPGYIFVDTAGWKDIKTADRMAWSAVIKVQKDLFWLGAAAGRWTFLEALQQLRDAHDRYKLPILIEDTPWARPLLQMLQDQLEGVVPFEIGGVPKEVRAAAAAPYQNAGNFYLPRRGQWTKEFVDEHAAFPNGAHDDWVDTTSMGALRLLRATIPTTASVVDEAELRRERMRGRTQDGWANV